MISLFYSDRKRRGGESEKVKFELSQTELVRIDKARLAKKRGWTVNL